MSAGANACESSLQILSSTLSNSSNNTAACISLVRCTGGRSCLFGHQRQQLEADSDREVPAPVVNAAAAAGVAVDGIGIWLNPVDGRIVAIHGTVVVMSVVVAMMPVAVVAMPAMMSMVAATAVMPMPAMVAMMSTAVTAGRVCHRR